MPLTLAAREAGHEVSVATGGRFVEMVQRAIIGLRVEATQELFIDSRTKAFAFGPETQSSAMNRVYVSGTAVRVR